MSNCKHDNFAAEVDVTKLETSGRMMADVRIKCADCDKPLRFIGLPVGLDLNGAAVSADGTEARIAVYPVGEVVPDLKDDAPGGFVITTDVTGLMSRVTELERLNLEAQNRIGDLCMLVGNIEQCRAVEGDCITILCDNPEADSIDTQSAVEACGDYTGYELQRFYGKNWEEALAKAAESSRRHYSEEEQS